MDVVSVVVMVEAGDSSDAAGEAEERTPGHTFVDDGHVFSYQ